MTLIDRTNRPYGPSLATGWRPPTSDACLPDNEGQPASGDDATGAGAVGDWVTVGPVTLAAPERGIAALVDEIPVAIFRIPSFASEFGSEPSAEQWFAVDHVDPRTGVAVMARGLVGSVGSVPVVYSPLHKECYSLESGECLDDGPFFLRTWAVEALEGEVRVLAGANRRM